MALTNSEKQAAHRERQALSQQQLIATSQLLAAQLTDTRKELEAARATIQTLQERVHQLELKVAKNRVPRKAPKAAAPTS
jgi:predicted nucleic acid-binding protein